MAIPYYPNSPKHNSRPLDEPGIVFFISFFTESLALSKVINYYLLEVFYLFTKIFVK